MRHREFLRVLRAVIGQHHRDPVGQRPQLREQLMAAYDARHPASPSKIRFIPRRILVVVGLVVLLPVLVAGACQLPAEYDIDVGHRFDIIMIGDPNAQARARHIVEYVEQFEGDLERVEATVRISNDGGESSRVHLRLDVVGEDIDPTEYWGRLLDHFPGLEGTLSENIPLEATVHGTLGGKIGHEVLDRVIDRHGVEEARRRVLQQLQRDGVDPEHADVQIEEDGEHRRVRIRVQQKAAGTAQR